MRWPLVVAVLGVGTVACGNGSRPGAVDPAPPSPSAPSEVGADRGVAAFPDGPCAVDADCVALQQEDSCCDMCGWRALTKEGLARFRAYCLGREVRCPAFDCPFEPRHAACVQGRCAAVPEAPPQGPACRPATAEERAAILEAERFLSEGGVLRGSPPPPPPPSPPPPTPGKRQIILEEVDVSRESLEAHAWGVQHSRTTPGELIVVFRYDADWLGHVYPADRVPAEQMRVGQAVEVVPGPRATQRFHQDFLLDRIERVCPAP